MVNEEYIDKLVDRLLEGYSDEKFNVREKGITFNDVSDGITLYHRPKDAIVTVGGEKMSVINSVFKYGFSREFTSSNGGNMYGAGVYTVYNLRSSNEKARGYGRAIIKLKLLGGYQDFLVFSKQLAQQTYGNNWNIRDQINLLFPSGVAQNVLKNVHFIMHDDRDAISKMLRSSDSAYNLVRMLGERNMNNSRCRGLVYNGGHDGGCCFIRDFSSVVPVAVSYDNGKTWKNRLTQNLLDRLSTEVDTHFQLGANAEFKDVASKSINGYTMVWNNAGKVNYVPANSNKPISDIWFDDGEPFKKTSDGLPWTNVKYGEYYLKIVFENGKYMVYDGNWEPQDFTIEELPEIIGQ